MSKNSRFIKLSSEIIHLILDTEDDIEKFLANQAQNYDESPMFELKQSIGGHLD
jgi:hypothetical protein